MVQRTTNVPDQYDAATWRAIMTDLDKRFKALEAAVGVYTVANFVPTRTLDMTSTNATNIGNFLATLVQDLQNARKLGGG